MSRSPGKALQSKMQLHVQRGEDLNPTHVSEEGVLAESKEKAGYPGQELIIYIVQD